MAKSKAKAAAKSLKHGTNMKAKRKTRSRVQFRRPKTLQLARRPKYQRKSTAGKISLSQFSVLKYPLTTESAMHKIEDFNTLVFIVDSRANKNQIKDAVRSMYDIESAKVNTLIR